MGGSQLACILHVCFQVPELLQPYSGDVDDVVGLRYRSFRMWSVIDCRAEWQHEAGKVLVQCKQAKHPCRHLTAVVGNGWVCCSGVLVCRYSFRVEVCYLENIDWNASSVSSAGPLRIQPPRLIVLVDVNRPVQLIQMVLLPPVFRVFELFESLFGVEFSCAKISTAPLLAWLARWAGTSLTAKSHHHGWGTSGRLSWAGNSHFSRRSF